MFKTFVYSLQDKGLDFDFSNDVHKLGCIEQAFVEKIDELWDRITRPDAYLVLKTPKPPTKKRPVKALENRLNKLQIYQRMRKIQTQRTSIVVNARNEIEVLRHDLRDRLQHIEKLEGSALSITEIEKAEGFLYVKLLRYESLTQKITERMVQVTALEYQYHTPATSEGDDATEEHDKLRIELQKQIRNHRRSINRWKQRRKMILESY